MNRILLTAALTALTLSLSAQSLTGQWKTIDDEIEGRVKSIVEITERDGQYFGTMVELFRLPDEDQDPHWTSATTTARTSACWAWTSSQHGGRRRRMGGRHRSATPRMAAYDLCGSRKADVLKVRGYWGFLYRTQEWIRQ